MMYAGDYDDTLPETGWDGPCQKPVEQHDGTSASVGDNYWSGVYAFPLADQPYMKNMDLVADPADPDKGVWGKEGSYCFEAQLLAFDQSAHAGTLDGKGFPGLLCRQLPFGSFLRCRPRQNHRKGSSDDGNRQSRKCLLRRRRRLRETVFRWRVCRLVHCAGLRQQRQWHRKMGERRTASGRTQLVVHRRTRQICQGSEVRRCIGRSGATASNHVGLPTAWNLFIPRDAKQRLLPQGR